MSGEARAADAAKSIAMMDCTLLDDNAAYNDAATAQQDAARVRVVSDELRSQLNKRALYRVADNGPADSMITGLRATQNLNACNGCELEIGRKLNVDRVGVCWVQKISNLILNINLRVEDVATGKMVFQRSVDMRGNTDRSWRRGASALVDLLAADRMLRSDAAHDGSDTARSAIADAGKGNRSFPK
nr:DUF3280 domain-containing protein [Paraburkholderia rhizosphaerae]